MLRGLARTAILGLALGIACPNRVFRVLITADTSLMLLALAWAADEEHRREQRRRAQLPRIAPGG